MEDVIKYLSKRYEWCFVKSHETHDKKDTCNCQTQAEIETSDAERQLERQALFFDIVSL